jgi:acetyl-CoA acyltransferase
MSFNQPVYVVGGGHSTFLGKGHPDFIHRKHPDFGTRTNPGIGDHVCEALKGAVESTGADLQQMDKVYVSNFLGEAFLKQGHLGSLLVALEPKLDGKPIARIEAACASGAAAIAASIDALQGHAETALVVGVEIETNVPGRDGIEYMAYAAHYEQQRGLDNFVFPYMFARRAKAYKEKFGATETDVARVVAKAYGNANRNPKAHMHSITMSLEEADSESRDNYRFLEDPDLRPHVRLHDCTQFVDGASAVVLATQAGLDRLGISKNDCTELLSYGHCVAALGAETDPLFLHNMNRAARQAYAHSGVSPDQLRLAEVHDCFAINELQMYEALELCDPGHGFRLLGEGHSHIEGRMPVNTGGGLIGFGHPIGATGVKQVVEIWRQMKSQCGDYQVSGDIDYAVSANLGGDDRTGIVMVHRNLS